MLIKCKCHGVKIDKDTAYCVRINDKNEYYCNENEYKKIIEERQSRVNTYNLINEIFGYKVINTILFKELSEIAGIYTFTKIYSYLSFNLSEMNKFMSKDFSSEYGKIRYFTTIIKNNIKDYKILKQENVKQSSMDIISNNYKSTTRKKSLDEYINDME